MIQKCYLFAFLLGFTLSHGLAAPGQRPGWKLTFADEFNGTTLDLEKWNPNDPWGRERNQELQAYVKDAFVVSNGMLHVMAEKREAFVLKHVEGMSYEEMAAATGARIPTLKMRVHRAREALLAALEEVVR